MRQRSPWLLTFHPSQFIRIDDKVVSSVSQPAVDLRVIENRTRTDPSQNAMLEIVGCALGEAVRQDFRAGRAASWSGGRAIWAYSQRLPGKRDAVEPCRC